MFYTYLRGLVILILWSINGNAHYHNTDKIPNQDENYILVAPHRTWWDPVYMAFATKPKQFIFMAKRSYFQIVSLAGGFVCVVLFLLIGKIPVPQLSNTQLTSSKKAIALSLCSQAVVAILMMSKVG